MCHHQTIVEGFFSSREHRSGWTRDQNSSSQSRGRQSKGVCFHKFIWKILKGNIRDSAADVWLCLHAWKWGLALWCEWKCTAEDCSMGESNLHSQSKSGGAPNSEFSQVSMQSLPSALRDVGTLHPIALIHFCLGRKRDHLVSPVGALKLCQQLQTIDTCRLPPTELIFTSTLPYCSSVMPVLLTTNSNLLRVFYYSEKHHLT